MRFDGIQCLRAFAVILVLWAHLKFVGGFAPHPFIASEAGASGVDIFFVISGFVIAMSAELSASSPRNTGWLSRRGTSLR